LQVRFFLLDLDLDLAVAGLVTSLASVQLDTCIAGVRHFDSVFRRS